MDFIANYSSDSEGEKEVVKSRTRKSYSTEFKLKAPDVSWNGPFKAHFRKSYDRWMMNDAQKEFTSGGNPKAPAIDVYLQWIVDAWESIPANAIAKSFKDCGITICHDGTEDDQVHCFKEHGSIPEGQFLLMEARYEMNHVAAEEEVDPEQDDENGYMSDASLEFETNDNMAYPESHFILLVENVNPATYLTFFS